MKKMIIAVIFLAAAAAGFAKGSDEMQTLFGSEKVKVGGYGGIELKATQINGEWGAMAGFRAGPIMNSVFSLGFGAYVSLTEHSVDSYKIGIDTNFYTPHLRMAYGGLNAEYTIAPNKVVHFTANLLIGAGWAGHTLSYNDMIDRHHDMEWFDNYGAFFVIEPTLNAEVNVTKFFRVALGMGYRFTSGLEIKNAFDQTVTTSKDLNGLSGTLTFKFGKF